MSKVLGLDVGSNSIGWAIIDLEEKKILDAGVRIFQEGVDRTAMGSELSKNATRRSARQSRRMNARWKARRNKLIYILTELGFYPETENEAKGYFKIDPYQVRAEGLDRKLKPFEFGRALYHINQRRGFKSNRKTAKKEEGAIFKGSQGKIGITDTQKAIEIGGFRTLGGISPQS